jgi:hypothetical protein
VLGGVAVGRGFEPQSDLELFFAEILISKEDFAMLKQLLRNIAQIAGLSRVAQWQWEGRAPITAHADIPGVFCRRKLLSRYRRTHGPHTYADCCLARRQVAANQNRCLPARYRQGRAAHQLLFVEDNARINLKIKKVVICTPVSFLPTKSR